ncbi:nuclear pore complex protein Nup214-like isoform X2 [Mytilus californianus]|uniref:nuclear pore complex protein Nup214-like isoform X2 n=1 Tax=Mytilus californianus TaxID=6549 RepID=UPI00224565EE|nr:nuclear pore complex protein Nup214-like isoform X2 [Mytilus californianus]
MATAGELPPERDVKDFRYQQLCRFQIDDGNSPVEGKSPQLVAASSKYGVIFVGTSKGFKVIQTSELSRIDREHAKDRTKIIVKEYPCLASIELSAPPSLLALSCDSLSLAVVVESADLSQVYIYDTRSFVSQGDQAPPFLRIRLNCGLADLAWNPENPTMLVCVMEDGSVSIFEAGDNLNIKATVPAQAKATCVCWSPKGKQLVVGQHDGLLAQYDQALVKKKEWTCPNILSGPQRVVGIIWLSTFSFMVAYIADNADASDQPTVVLITGSKEAPPKYTSLEDPCYGGGEERLKKFFFHYIPAWEMITATSSTAIEIAVLGKHFDNKTIMERWNLEDSARAEIPMTADHCEAYTMGVAIDFSSQMPLPLSEETTLPPCPILLVLSSEGILIPFYMVYTHSETPVLTSAAAVLSAEGARKPKASSVAPGTQPSAGIQQTQPSVPAGPSFQFVSTKPAPTGTASPFSFTSSTMAPPTVTPAASQDKSAATSSSGFGISTPQSTGFNFGAKPTSTSTSESSSTKPSSFGTPSSEPTSTKPSIFGTQASGASIFGSTPSSNPSATKQSMFGVPAGNGSVLGTSGTGTSESSSTKQGLFGTSVGGTSIFGSTPKTTPTAAPTSIFSAAPTGTGSGFSFSATLASNSTSSTLASSSTSSTPISFNFAKPSGGTVSSSAPPASSNVQTPLFSTPVASKSFSTPASSNETGYKLGPGLGGVTPGNTLLPKQPTGGPGKPEVSKQGSQQSQPQPNVKTEESKHKTVQPRVPSSQSQQSQPRVPSSQSQQSQQEEETVDSTYTKSIMEEMTHFEEELKQFRNRTLSHKVAVGDIREMEKLKKTTEEMTKFNEEVKKLTKDQTKEIEDTKSLLLDSYSMIEECKMREQRNTDPKYIHLLRSKTLDPANQERLRSLQQKYQILDRGLRECDTILDNQWQEYQNKNKRHARINTPTTDLIYRSIKSNRNVILHQNLELSDLESKLKQLKIYNKTSSWQDTFNESRSAELSSLADSLLESKSAPLSSSKITETTSPQKMARLREHLSRRSVPRIKSTRPENLSMSRIVTVETVASRNQQKAPPVQNEAPVTNGFKVQQQFDQPDVRPQYQTSSIQQQARSLTGSAIRFQQTKPANMNFGQSGMTVSGDRNQSGGRFESQPRMTEGFNAVKRSYGVLPPDDLRPTLSGIEDITPPSSTGYEEDEEDEETETETNDDEEGFGPQYNIPSEESSDSETEVLGSGKVTSTPLSSVRPDMPKSSPVVTSRNLFGSPKPSDVSTTTKPFSFGGTDTTKGFSFGGSADSNGGAIPKNPNGFAFKSNASIATGLAEKVSSTSSSTTNNIPSTGYKFGQTGTSAFGSESFSTTTGSSAGFDFSAGRKTDETKNDKSTSDLGGGESTADVSKSASQLSLDGTTITAKPTGSSFSFSAGASSSQNITGLFGSKHNVQKTSSSESTTKSKETVEVATNENKPVSGFSFSQSFGSIPPTGSSGVDTTPKTSKETGCKQGETTQKEQPSSSVSRSLFGSPDTGATSSVLGQATSSDDPKISSTGTGIFGTSSSSETGLFGKTAVSHSVSSTSNNTGLFGKTAVSQSVSSTSNNTGLFGKTAVSQSVSSTSNNTGLFGKKVSTDGQTPTTTVTSSEATANSETLNQQKEESEETVTTSSAVTDEISGSNVPATTSNASGGGLFGQTSSATTGIFGQTTSAAGTGLFGQKPALGLFGQTTTTGTLFGQSSSAASTIAPFGQGTTTSTSSPFGQTSTTTAENLFLQKSSSTPSSLFGQTPSTTSSNGLFGQTTNSSSGGLFGQTTTTSTGLFGQPSSSSSGLFGQPASSSGGLFGQTTSPTSSGGLFGQTTSATSSGGIFGQPTSTPSSGGLFGQSTSTPSSGGMFGQTTSSPAGGLFGQPASSAGTSVFGQPAGTSVFGQPTSSAGTSVFGQPAGTSVFGQPTSSTGTSVFGQPVSSGSSGFGQTSAFGQKTTAPGFGQTAFGQTAFGQTSSSFGGTATTSSSGGGIFGGSSFGGLGGQPSTERANTNVFGSTSFGTTTTSSTGSIFGNQGSSTFGAKSSSTFGGVGGFTSGGGSVAASGFGVASQQTSPSGFGAPAAFGGSPSFGTAPAFGTSQAFGSSPTFGGSGATGFGSQPVFGNPVGGNTMFGSPQPGQSAGFAGYGGTGSSPTFEALAGRSHVPIFASVLLYT